MERAREQTGEVVRSERLGELYELTVRLPHLAANAAPGEFAQLRCGSSLSPLLRRPFSVAWTKGDECSFVFQVVGAGTGALAGLRPGDTVDALGPLGHGFSLDVRGRVVCVSGGVGCAPFPLLIRALHDHDVRDIVVLNGAATADRLYPAGRFARGLHGVQVVEATDDGSRGTRGLVTDLLTPALGGVPAAVFACGPNAMLAAVARDLDAVSGYRGEASLEAPMGCGFGTCLGCALPLRTPDPGNAWALCCTAGPVFPLAAIDWEQLMRLPEPSVA